MEAKKIKNIGFVFGNGELPILLLEKCPQSFCALIGNTPSNINICKKFQHFQITEIPQILDFFKENGVTHICLAGGVTKPKLNIKLLNFRILPLLWKILTLKNKGDNNLLTTILSYIENKGFKVISATEIIPDLLTQEGCLTNIKPKNHHFSSIKLAINFLNDISKYDISQACVVENDCITALEGIEGTAQMIARTKEFNKGDAILVKIPKKGQTLKVDMPTIGIKTIKQCIEANISGIVLKAESTIILNKEEIIALANQKNIFVYSVN
jgi:DUF1009 family protein